jgi:iron complex transport system substrate-binding protein
MTLRRLIPSMLLISAFAGACMNAPAPTANQPPSGGTSVGTPAPAVPSPAATPIRLTDGLGREVTLETPPERIVIAGRASALLADAVYLFPEAKDRVQAVEARSQRNSTFLPLVDPDFDTKAVLERDASAEQILPLQPDLVLMKSFMAESLGESLEQLGVPVVYLDLETPEQYERDLATLGAVFASPGRAQELLAYYGERTALVEEFSSAAVQGTPPRIMILQFEEESGVVSVEVPSASWLQTRMAEMVSAEPVWVEAASGGGWTIVGFEQIAAWDPDQIYLIDYFGNSSQAAAALKQDANWAALQAVQTNQLHGFPTDFLSWDQPDPRWILGLQWLATKVHPEIADEIDLLAEIDSFYVEMYGLSPSVVEEQVLDRLTGDLQ